MSGLSGKTNFSRPQKANVSVENLKSTDYAKATFNQVALDIGICTIDNFNKVLAEMTKHAFPAYAFHEQKRYLRRHLIKPRSMKRRSFISKLQEPSVYLEEFPPDTEGQETVPLSTDEIVDIIYHSMSTIQKNKMIEQGINYADSTIKEMTDIFKTRVKNLEPKEEKKKPSAAAKKSEDEKSFKKRKDHILTLLSQSPVKLLLWNLCQTKKSLFYKEKEIALC